MCTTRNARERSHMRAEMVAVCAKDAAHYDFAFEDIVSRPHEQMRILAQQLGLEDQARAHPFHAALQAAAQQHDVCMPMT